MLAVEQPSIRWHAESNHGLDLLVRLHQTKPEYFCCVLVSTAACVTIFVLCKF